uniref:TIR domain-containing protein n=1 Tax=Chromera velia CCMP2878 TaxID=1169474 RepID=A0A0G4FVH0_9ALVE|eukprot:Cvel_18824.t1-p1 / transcript=Cvel_18824.t1 / gene=Cvel_18824 / organism=Chromera_velia_CCMP2878 / gene_product=Histone-lysine N-methyltransferase EHMT2, putative / transcript_product=Histone-lysine N-methyltransferase EHMT2, putative / location=Cvel_scaffold1581:31678-33817(-) / protein_length=465 / sequence_SO=supercontig / SO=protein_coding / is_pseudo=false
MPRHSNFGGDGSLQKIGLSSLATLGVLACLFVKEMSSWNQVALIAGSAAAAGALMWLLLREKPDGSSLPPGGSPSPTGGESGEGEHRSHPPPSDIESDNCSDFDEPELVAERNFDVFLSHTKRSTTSGTFPFITATLIPWLRSRGLTAFFDSSNLPGRPIPECLSVVKRSRVVLLILDDSTLECEWVLKELKTAVDHNVPIVCVHQGGRGGVKVGEMKKKWEERLGHHPGYGEGFVKKVFIHGAIEFVVHPEYLEVLKRLYAKLEQGWIGWSPLHDAAHRGCVDDADVNGKTRTGWTPLLDATYRGHVAVVRVLLANGAAVKYGREGKPGCEGWTALHEAAKHNHAGVAEVLITEGKAGVNGKTRTGWTPLLEAADRGHVAVVRVLLTNGADVKYGREGKPGCEGWTALHEAAKHSHAGVAEVLITEGKADVKREDRKNRTPLWVARENRSQGVEKVLRDKGAQS